MAIMSTLDAAPHGVPNANHLGMSDIPPDVLILILSSLHGQDVARCMAVCHAFADVILSDLSLQYRIELAQNGMVDGESSTLSISEKLQRIRQYSSNFKSGAFQHEDLTAHPDYVLRQAELGWPRDVIFPEGPSGAVFRKSYQEDSPLHISLFVPGSAQAGIPSSRSLFSVREAVKPEVNAKLWAMDDAQDLFVVVEMTRISDRWETYGRTDVVASINMRFYSLSGLKTGTVTSHPAATLPLIQPRISRPAEPANVYELHVVGDYVILEIHEEIGIRTRHLMDVYNWKTGQMVSRTNVGDVMVNIIPLDEPYLLLVPRASTMGMVVGEPLNVMIYSFSQPSESGQPQARARVAAGRHVCTLELPLPPPGERIVWSRVHTGDRRPEETTGYFHTDWSRSIVVLDLQLGAAEESDDEDEDEGDDDDDDDPTMCFLIPRTTLASQIKAAESPHKQNNGDNARSGSDSDDSDSDRPRSVPWAEWGPRGCLQLHLRSTALIRYRGLQRPFGSRLPVAVFHSDTGKREDDWESAMSVYVYVFDVNPLVARSLPSQPIEGGMATTTAIVEDIEEVLPGAVDPECAAVPYAVYRFPLSNSIAGINGRAGAPPGITEVAMSMTGFTVEFHAGSLPYEKRFQTWTV